MKKIILGILAVMTLTSCNFFTGLKSNVEEDGFLYVKTNSTMDAVMDSLQGKLKDIKSFRKYAEAKDYASEIKPGKYKLEKGESNSSLLDKLIDGKQTEVHLMVKNEPTIFHLAGSVSKKIEADSVQIVESIVKLAKSKNLDAETVKQYFIPNTYNYWWATSADTFVEKMMKEYDKVWTEERQNKAKSMNFTSLQVFTLASIVQLEASKVDEQPKVAQAYLNRLAKDMRLEADPTSIYAYRLQNGFNNKIQRVYHGHLAIPSDYNTYRVKGLPPAPICMPNMTAIDAVLNPDGHDFIYFCADPDRPGYHSFTNDYEEHKRNAEKYRKWLEDNNIR
ncbi:endolytic transglycosylase MltG [Moheibacter sediminis]|uniref:Endolytic murein transglycosylase n=1 Tax=Moheibacter sediminis TaxID=1434700 RepID=A0A1W2C0B4_9FLAO|nr:endolytic transglycosylase MltG [Moheibacter sediminis]SMC78352.1 UPF0755 protein [Moheibacter sediminis]